MALVVEGPNTKKTLGGLLDWNVTTPLSRLGFPPRCYAKLWPLTSWSSSLMADKGSENVDHATDKVADCQTWTSGA